MRSSNHVDLEVGLGFQAGAGTGNRPGKRCFQKTRNARAVQAKTMLDLGYYSERYSLIFSGMKAENHPWTLWDFSFTVL